MEAIKATTARRGRRLARASSRRVMFICAAMKRAASWEVSQFRCFVRQSWCAAPCSLCSLLTARSLHLALTPPPARCFHRYKTRLNVTQPLSLHQIRTSGILGSFSTWWKHTVERHPLWRIASRLPPGNPESVRIRHNLALVRTQSSTVANSVTLRGTPVVEGTRTRIVCNPPAIRLALRYAISEKPTVTIHIHSSHASQ